MKNKFILSKCLLTVVLAFSLMVSSTNTVSAAEITGSVTEEKAEDSVAENCDMETPIALEEDSDYTDEAMTEDADTDESAGAEVKEADEALETEEPVVDDPDSSDESVDSDAADSASEDAAHNTTDDSTEIDITGITPDNIIFMDDIVYINPCYKDVITEDDLEDAPEEEAPDLSSALTVFSEENVNGTTYYTTEEEAAAVIRSMMTQHEKTISFGFVCTTDDISGEMTTLFTKALTHTGVCNEGDYLKWGYGGWQGAIKGFNSNGSHYLIYTYTMTYYTTLDQESVFVAKVDSIFSELGINSLGSDYEKIKTIYQYICSHVTYDYTNLNDSSYKLKYTAYAALINGTAVCQGYALAFYYMCLKAGIDARFISGDANGGRHGWNIVQLNGLYYDADSTWDAHFGSVVESYKYFLKCNADFPNHTRDADYNTDSFNTTYPMAAESYAAQTEEPITVTVYGHSLFLNGMIGLNFYLDLSDAAANTAGSFVTLQNSVSGEIEQIDLDDASVADGHYCFTFSEAAKEMADPVILTFYDGTTGESLCTDTYSVSEYAAEQIAAGNNVSDLVTAMLNYGTCAQTYFDYQTGNPANEVISTSGSAATADVDASILSAYARVKSGTLPEGISAYGQSLVLNDGVSVKFYYQLSDGADISDYTATLVSGGSSTVLQWQESGDSSCYYVSVEDVNAADLDTMYEVDITNGTTTGSVQYGAMTYVYNTLTATEGCSDSLKNLCCALYYYSQAAELYLAE